MATGRSPYRQTANAGSKDPKPSNNNQRGRSKSRDIGHSPRPSAGTDSQLMTEPEGFQSDSSQDEQLDRIDSYLKNLKEKKGSRNSGKQKEKGGQASGTKIQKRL
jgi:hypothetical protein